MGVPAIDIVSSDGQAPVSRDTVVSDALPDALDASTVAPTSPCRSDCCVSGTFCCGNKCQREDLRAVFSCPATATCCSNSNLICSDPSKVPVTAPSAAPAPAPVALESGAPQPAVSSNGELCDDGCEPWWAQCGGERYLGPGCCTGGSTCEPTNPVVSLCVPDNNSPLCSSGPPENAGAFCQCGGATFLGPQECGPGLLCVPVNAFYSQCRPACATNNGSDREERESS
jgi:hypothetical protein